VNLINESVIVARDRFVYQVVVPKALAPRELVKVFDSGEAIVLPPWDPMVMHPLALIIDHADACWTGFPRLNRTISCMSLMMTLAGGISFIRWDASYCTYGLPLPAHSFPCS
jgi:hypothetical protein